MKIELTPAQLTAAQMGKIVVLNTGDRFEARWYEKRGQWAYALIHNDYLWWVRYSEPGLEEAQWIVNLSDHNYEWFDAYGRHGLDGPTE
jgi:hypothetical protein